MEPIPVTTITLCGSPLNPATLTVEPGFDVTFIPPDFISGKSCLLQVHTASVMYTTYPDHPRNEECVFLFKLSWRQPNSYMSVYDEFYKPDAEHRQGKVVAGNYNTCVAATVSGMQNQGGFAPAMVDIPQGPHTLHVSVQQITPNRPQEDFPYLPIDNITITATLTPFQGQ